MKTLHTTLAAAAALALVFWASSAHAQESDGDTLELPMIARINAYRLAHGLEPLTPIGRLFVAARAHSRDMATRGYFSHASPEGLSPFDRMHQVGYDSRGMGENLAAGNEGVAATFEQWRTSPAHNAAMLDPQYRAIGVGRVCDEGSRYGCYWTADFGDTVDDTALGPPPVPAAALATVGVPMPGEDGPVLAARRVALVQCPHAERNASRSRRRNHRRR